MKWSSLQKRVSKFTPKKIYEIDPGHDWQNLDKTETRLRQDWDQDWDIAKTRLRWDWDKTETKTETLLRQDQD